jgi:thiol-disulfide isomerase/thioredoxin
MIRQQIEPPATSVGEFPIAPPLQVAQWFNVPASYGAENFSLATLRGKVVFVHAFQMLCPGCVLEGMPQAKRVAETFDPKSVAVIGLHTVFEHHAAMTPVALEAFVHEFRLPFPIGVDRPRVDDRIPETMLAYRMRGTPTSLLIDKQGRLRAQHFGVESDLALGARIAGLLAEPLA